MNLGTELRAARERAGFSLPQLAARTRIPLKTLEAIEENDFSKVPPGIFVRSFIRTYAQEVGVDPATAVSEYRAMMDPVSDLAQEQHEPAVADESVRPRALPIDLTESRPGWGYALIAAALLVGWISMNRGDDPDPPDVAAATTRVETAAPVEPAQAVATTGNGIQIAVRAVQLCWIKATVDGQPAFAGVLQPGETQSFAAQRDLVLRVGDPAALSYSLNGRVGEPLGPARVPITVRFDSDGRVSRVS